MDGCAAAFTTKQCLQSHYRKIHSFDEKSMPKIERSVSYTFHAYSGAQKNGNAPPEEEDSDSKKNILDENCMFCLKLYNALLTFNFAAANSDMFDDVNLQSPQMENNDDKPATPPPISSLSPSQTLHTIDHITRDTSTPKIITKGIVWFLYRVV